MTEAKKPTADWAVIERDYRAGVKSLREIAGEHGITEGAIRKKAKNATPPWERDLKAKIQQRADNLLAKQAVREEDRAANKATEAVVVEANAQAILAVRLAHRNDIARSRKLALKLLDELELETDNMGLLEELGTLMRREDKNGVDRLNDLYHKVISLPGRIKGMKDLGDTLNTLVALEREAWGIDGVEKPPAYEDLPDHELNAKLAAYVERLSAPAVQ